MAVGVCFKDLAHGNVMTGAISPVFNVAVMHTLVADGGAQHIVGAVVDDVETRQSLAAQHTFRAAAQFARISAVSDYGGGDAHYKFGSSASSTA